jgi:hypothetical protein
LLLQVIILKKSHTASTGLEKMVSDRDD